MNNLVNENEMSIKQDEKQIDGKIRKREINKLRERGER